MNIIIITADDLGWNDVGYHNSEVKTPNIDALAAEGTKLERCYAQPLCTPSRAAMLTGRLPYRYGLQRLLFPWYNYGLDLKEKLLPEYLKEKGYECHLVGKWHLGHHTNKYLPTSRGFDTHFGCYNGVIDYWKHNCWNAHDFHFNRKPIYPKGHSTDLFTSRIIEILNNHVKPFFIMASFTAPHFPLQPLPEFIDKSIKDRKRRDFLGLVRHLDYSIGKIIETLKKNKQLEDTLIWFTSDNGGAITEGANNYPLKGSKTGVSEGGIRVINFINRKFTNSTNNDLHHIVDMAPTIFDLIGIEKPSELDGKSILEKSQERDIIHCFKQPHSFWRFTQGNQVYGCITSNEYKLLYFPEPCKPAFLELYNIEQDPLEKTNLFNSLPEVVNKLIEKLKNCSKDFVADPNLWNYKDKNGYPPKYKFPKVWGPKRENRITMLSQEEDRQEGLETIFDLDKINSWVD